MKTKTASAYPEEILTVLRGLTEGEVASDIIETDTGYYVVRLDKVLDEDATASKRESLKSSKEEDYYTETTDGWLDDADVKEVKKVLKTLKITDSHTFTAPTATPTPEVTEEAREATEAPAAQKHRKQQRHQQLLRHRKQQKHRKLLRHQQQQKHRHQQLHRLRNNQDK